MTREANEWLEMAEQHFDDAAHNAADGRHGTAGFLLHQTVEKALKAVRIQESGAYEADDDLEALCSDRVPGRYREMLPALNQLYVSFYYPDVEDGEMVLDEVPRLQRQVSSFLAWTRRQVRREVAVA